MIKTILAIIEGSAPAKAFVDAVLGLANHHAAHVIFDVLTAAPMISSKLAPVGTIFTPPDQILYQATRDVGIVRALLPSGVPAEVVSHFDDVGWLPGDLRAHAPAADLIVIGPRTSWAIDWLRRRAVESLLFSAGTPLLLLPPGKTLRSVNHAVMGWKAGAPAAHCLHALIGIAEPGARIDVVSVKHGLNDEPETVTDSVVQLLKRHGFCVEGHRLDRGEAVHDALAAFALERNADVLAVGDFAHSRIHEVILGGVTRGLIENPQLPVLMAH